MALISATERRQSIVAEKLMDYDPSKSTDTRWAYDPSTGHSAFVFFTEYRATPGPLERDLIEISVLNERELYFLYKARTRTLLSPAEHIRYDDQEKIILEERGTEGERNISRAQMLRGVFSSLQLSFGRYMALVKLGEDEKMAATRVQQGLGDLAMILSRTAQKPWHHGLPSSMPRPRPV